MLNEDKQGNAIDLRRDQIISAAVEVFLSSGFDRTSMVDIAKQAQVSKQTLYSHFGSKESLFREAIQRACREHTPAELMLQSEPDLTRSLTKIGSELCGLLFSDDAIRLESLCIGCDQAKQETAEIFWQAGPNWVQEQLTHYFGQHIERGNLRPADPELLASQFMSLLCGELRIKALMGIAEPAPADIERLVQTTVELMIAAYGH